MNPLASTGGYRSRDRRLGSAYLLIPLALLIGAMTVAAYYPALRGDFVWDDDLYLTQNRIVQADDGIRTIWLHPSSLPSPYPLAVSALWLQHRLWGLDPFGYHAVNLALHLLNSLLVGLVLRRLMVPGAWLAAAIFALHPVHVESVAWISEIKDVLSGFFFLFSLFVWLRFADRGGWPAYTLSFVLFIAAVLTKTVTCMFPVAALLLVAWRWPGSIKRASVAAIPYFVVALLAGVLTAWWERHRTGATAEAIPLEPLERLLIAGRAPWFYTLKLIWPGGLTAIYPKWDLSIHAVIQWVFLAATILAIVLVILFRRRLGGVSVAAAWFMILLAPALGFINFSTMVYTWVADHYQYLASIGGIALLAALARAAFKSSRMWGALGVMAALGALAVGSWKVASTYQNMQTLFGDNVEKNPQSWCAYYNLAWDLARREKFAESIPFYEKTIEIRPGDLKALNGLGLAAMALGDGRKAMECFNRALEIDPNHPETVGNIGLLYFNVGNFDKAIGYYSRAVKIRPDDPRTLNNLGLAWLQMGDPPGAENYFRQVLRIQPDHVSAWNHLGNALMRQDKVPEGMEAYRKAIAIKPDYAEAWNNLGIATMRAGDAKEAIRCFERALQIDPSFSAAIRNLEAALKR